ncbi:hypothetical protein HM1_0703 [Heliomicrobium modesticaldum Ice1]|uniref:Uncharacterized protein n=1 Tax=Heliobacterium modesticaldum (strain ATCC 51547 / Ice1) TaxID=498761 RepID=B0TBL0_HELMI|nr:hypothetical protein HM1_0703 [Heliomicrobium modesticaldum Ice1]
MTLRIILAIIFNKYLLKDIQSMSEKWMKNRGFSAENAEPTQSK